MIENQTEGPGLDYSGLGKVSDLSLSTEDLRVWVDTLWEMIMVMDRETREQTYFPRVSWEDALDGLERDSERFPFDDPQHNAKFLANTAVFKRKIKKIKPVIDVLVKLKNVLNEDN